MTKNALGVEVPAGSDAFDPQGDMVELGASLAGRLIVPVANATARDALLASLGLDTTVNPLVVFRMDTGSIQAYWGASGPWRTWGAGSASSAAMTQPAGYTLGEALTTVTGTELTLGVGTWALIASGYADWATVGPPRTTVGIYQSPSVLLHQASIFTNSIVGSVPISCVHLLAVTSGTTQVRLAAQATGGGGGNAVLQVPRLLALPVAGA